MNRDTTERDRPFEWLRNLHEGAAYGELLKDSGDLVVAAYRVARARCRAAAVACHVPTLREVHAAVRELFDHGHADDLPTLRRLEFDCERAGLVVIR